MSHNSLSPSSALNKGLMGCITAKPTLTSSQLDDVRDFLEELDVIPLSALPPEFWPLVYEHQRKLANNEIPFDDFYEKPFYERLHERLKLRKSQRKQINDEQFKLDL